MTTHATVLQYVAKAWPNPPWSPESQAIFRKALEGMDPAKLLAAAQDFYRTDSKGFRPTPGQLAALAAGSDSDARAIAAWDRIRAAFHAGEAVDEPSGLDQRARQALKNAGGYRQLLGGIDAKEAAFVRMRFLKAYRALDTERVAIERLAAANDLYLSQLSEEPRQ